MNDGNFLFNFPLRRDGVLCNREKVNSLLAINQSRVFLVPSFPVCNTRYETQSCEYFDFNFYGISKLLRREKCYDVMAIIAFLERCLRNENIEMNDYF